MVLDWFTLFGVVSAVGVVYLMLKLCSRRSCNK